MSSFKLNQQDMASNFIYVLLSLFSTLYFLRYKYDRFPQLKIKDLLSRETGGKVCSAPSCYGSSLWVRIKTSLTKYKMGDISKGVANTLYPSKKINKTKKFEGKNYLNKLVSRVGKNPGFF
jgi:hypothetical protein